MIQQYFVDVTLDWNASLSQKLQQLVEDAEQELGTPYIEVAQVIKHDNMQYTVIINADQSDQEDQEEKEEEK
ncbi:hypothetical protein [Paenibacillus hamazuiensis]|uniref:hypothetical protein n=1 Tax=Paenibacillus hamazuiensis TaxID=2936508 RepID=UPI00200FA9CE|nr:hypothetical protein [Paenibacillus hamazuiensis]